MALLRFNTKLTKLQIKRTFLENLLKSASWKQCTSLVTERAHTDSSSLHFGCLQENKYHVTNKLLPASSFAPLSSPTHTNVCYSRNSTDLSYM